MIVDGKFLPPGNFIEIFNENNNDTKAFYGYNFINNKQLP
jgi:hypothetical protein